MPKSPVPVLLVFFVLIVIVYAVKGYRNAGRPKMSDPLAGDALVLVQLKEAGSDLSKPHSTEFFLYFPTQEAAQQAAEQIRSKGFGVKVDRAAVGPTWLRLATKWMVPPSNQVDGAGLSDACGYPRRL